MQIVQNEDVQLRIQRDHILVRFANNVDTNGEPKPAEENPLCSSETE